MSNEIHNPTTTLPANAKKVWRITGLIEDAIGLVVIAILLFLDHYFQWVEWLGWIFIGLAVLSIPSIIWTFVRPHLLYKSWRYNADEEFLHLKFGTITEKHELIPMTKIQAVTTNKGPILKKYGLMSISVETMGSSHTIPCLQEDVALALRDEIAQYAKLKEVE
ncbi:PH domain-containing protein [Bacillus mesophilum]|uniref:PH domain-containing protein n=1 Tax=Bacillus mesophilum TaxID=1071718 RepID=A0A7V7UX98_9BACI|nr:PH domain-containing protein [Bacillus mesophilum]